MKSACLGDVAEFVNGFAFKPSHWEDTGSPIIRIQNLNDPNKPFNRTKHEVPTKYVARPGDLLVSWSASLGVFTWDMPEPGLVNQHIFKVVPNAAVVDRAYLRHMLVGALADMEKHLHGATMKHINRAEFLATQIPLPSLAEQRRIASILNQAETLRATRRKADALLSSLTTALYRQMFGDPLTNDHGWPVERLGALASTTSGGTPNRADQGNYGGSVPWIKSGELGVERILAAEEFLTERGLASSSAKIVQPGAVLVAMYGATAGAVSVLGIQAATNQAVCAISVGPRLERDFLVATLRAMNSTLLAKRAGGAQPNLSQAVLRALPIPIPPSHLQREFADKLGAVRTLHHHVASSDFDALLASLRAQAFARGL